MLVEFSIYWKSRLFLVLIGAFWVVRLFPSSSRCDNLTVLAEALSWPVRNAAGAVAEAGGDLGAWLAHHAAEGDELGQRGVDVPDLPVHLAGRPAAAVPPDGHAAVPAEHQASSPQETHLTKSTRSSMQAAVQMQRYRSVRDLRLTWQGT